MVKMSENSRHLARLFIEKLRPTFRPRSCRSSTRPAGSASPSPSCRSITCCSRLGPDRTRGDGGRGAEPVPGDAGTRWQGARRRLRRLPASHRGERILFVKYLNAGQICTTVDHAWLPPQHIDAFVRHAREIVPARYPRLDSPDYTSIIDERSFDRLLHALDDARERGAQVLAAAAGPPFDRATRKIAPHIVLDAPDDSLLMQREIFGPILPLRSYTSLDEVIDRINAGPRPLALYPFSHDRRQVQRLLERVISGGVTVNDALFHVGQHDLPSVASATRAWAITTAMKASSPSRSCVRSSTRRASPP